MYRPQEPAYRLLDMATRKQARSRRQSNPAPRAPDAVFTKPTASAIARTKPGGDPVVDHAELAVRAVRVSISSLKTLQNVRAERARLDRDELEAVTAARAVGVSWQRIADALGVTRSAAHQRWAAHPSIRARAGSSK